MLTRSSSTVKLSPALPPPERMTSAAPDAIDLLVDVDRRVLAGLVDLVGHRRRVVAALGPPEERAALLAVVGSLGVDEPAFRTVDGHRQAFSSSGSCGTLPSRMSVSCWTSAPVSADSPSSRSNLEPVDELSAKDVDLAVQHTAAVGNLVLVLGELRDQVLELLIAHVAHVGERLVVVGAHQTSSLAGAGGCPNSVAEPIIGPICKLQLELDGCTAACGHGAAGRADVDEGRRDGHRDAHARSPRG